MFVQHLFHHHSSKQVHPTKDPKKTKLGLETVFWYFFVIENNVAELKTSKTPRSPAAKTTKNNAGLLLLTGTTRW